MSDINVLQIEKYKLNFIGGWIDAQMGYGTSLSSVELYSPSTLRAEEAVWAKVRRCMDAYAQRLSAVGNLDTVRRYHEVYGALTELGPVVLSKFRAKAEL